MAEDYKMNDLFRRVEFNFEKQGLMKTLNASLDKVQEGLVQISVKFHEGLSQQHHFFHAGIITSIADSACGYAAFTLAPPDKDVLTVEFKVNFIRPANSTKLTAIGNVIHPGKTLTVCEANVYDPNDKLIARMTATIMTMAEK